MPFSAEDNPLTGPRRGCITVERNAEFHTTDPLAAGFTGFESGRLLCGGKCYRILCIVRG